MREKLATHEREIAENRHKINNLVMVTDLKLEKISGDITELKNALKWAGGLIISLMLSFMAWAALQQYNANETQKRELQEQVKLLQSQEQAQADRARILQELQRTSGSVSGGSEAPVTPRR